MRLELKAQDRDKGTYIRNLDRMFWFRDRRAEGGPAADRHTSKKKARAAPGRVLRILHDQIRRTGARMTGSFPRMRGEAPGPST